MKNIYFIILLSIITIHSSFAQDDTTAVDPDWKFKFSAGLNVNQASFSDNWKAGGVNSVAMGTFLNFKADYTKNRFSFINDLQLQYGIVQNSGETLRKNIDRIFLDTKISYKIAKSWDFFGAVTFQSQFDAGFGKVKDALGNDVDARISDFLAPGYVSEAIGIQYKPTDFFFIQFGTGALRQTIVQSNVIYLSEIPNYGVEYPKYLRNEVAFQLVIGLDKDIAKNMNLKFRYVGFANYETIDRVETIDHRLDLSITAKVTRFINVNLTGVGLYDIDQDLSFQYSQALSLGILYNIQNFVEKK